MTDKVTNSNVNIPTTVQSDDQTVNVTAQHSSAAKGGEAITKGLDNAAGAAETAGQYTKDAYVAGKDSAAKAKDQVKATSRDAWDKTKDGANTVGTKAKQAGESAKVGLENAGQTAKVNLEKAGTKAKEVGAQAYDAAADASNRVGAGARNFFQRIGDGWRRSIEAGTGERPITFLGLNSVPLATAGAILGLGLGIAGLFTAFTIYVPLSAILIGAGVISLLDLAISLAYRSSVKANDPTARPLTALSEHGSTALTDDERLAHIASECDLFIDSGEAKLRNLETKASDVDGQIASSQEQIAAHQAQLEELKTQKTTILEQHNAHVVGLPEHIRQALENVDGLQQSIEQKHQDIKDLKETQKGLIKEQAKLVAEHEAQLTSLTSEEKKVAGNVAKTKTLRASLNRIDHETDTHQSGHVVEIETSSKSKNKGKQREVSSAA